MIAWSRCGPMAYANLTRTLREAYANFCLQYQIESIKCQKVKYQESSIKHSLSFLSVWLIKNPIDAQIHTFNTQIHTFDQASVNNHIHTFSLASVKIHIFYQASVNDHIHTCIHETIASILSIHKFTLASMKQSSIRETIASTIRRFDLAAD